MIDRKTLEPQIPANWQADHDQYTKLAKAEKSARNRYRNNVDSAYEPVPALLQVLEQTEALAQSEPQIRALNNAIGELSHDAAMAQIAEVSKSLGLIAGSSKVKSKLSKARRALKGKKADPLKSQRFVEEGLSILATELQWRRQAAEQLSPALNTYEIAIKDSIGLRLQQRLSIEQAEYVASCRSSHKDISLHF